MKRILLIIVMLPFAALAQQPKNAGWYIVQKNAQYSTMFPSFYEFAISKKNMEQVVLSNYQMKVGEAVLVFDFSNDKYLCFDPMGRIVSFNGSYSLQKATLNEVSSVGIIVQDIETLEGNNLTKGMYLWIISQDIGKGTVTVQLDGNRQLEIPKSSINLASKTLRVASQDLQYQTAQ